MDGTDKPVVSVWHEGELLIQQRAGVRHQADDLTGMYKRDVPAGMAGFLTQQQFAVLSAEDANHRVWANLIAGTPGMIDVRDVNTVALVPSNIETKLPVHDIAADAKVGLLAIDFARRIRVRVNGEALFEPDGSIDIRIAQLYGNCSQYIQKRVLDCQGVSAVNGHVNSSAILSESQQQFVSRADTFFLASRHPQHGADASHRGGKPGFVFATSPTQISFPDYSGNNMFNTLGNIAVNPAVGLLFVNFETGDTLQVSGRASVDWDPARAAQFPNAHRVIDIEVNAARETIAATSLRYRFIGYSPTLG